MASSDTTTTDLASAEILWKAAEALRGQIDAAEYKHVVLAATHLRIQAVRLRSLSVNPVLTSGNGTRSAGTQTSEFAACK